MWIEAAFRTVPVAMSFIDRDLRYLKVNEATAAITGRPIEEHVGRTLREINPLVTAEMESLIRGVIESGQPCVRYSLSRPTPHASGGSLELVMHVSPLHDPDGGIVGACVTATDVTEWKHFQDRLSQVQKLTAAGELAASIAHDFNNLLTIVGSNCDLLLMDLPADDAHREGIEEIRIAAGRACALARRMLGTAHHRLLKPKPVQLRTIVLEARDLLEHAVRMGARLEARAGDDAGVIVMDQTQVEQVLLNLVINAVHAMPQGGTVSVTTRDVELERLTLFRTGELAAGAYAELVVADTGTGMDEATVSRIFEPFFTTKPPGQGTGLGLATVFSIVRDLGGAIDVESQLGHGTRFRVLFPRATTEQARDPDVSRTVVADAIPRGTETILVVEDEDILRAIVARVLSRHGYRVLEARHGGEALRTIAAEPDIALVMSDLHMPGMDGLELSTRLRARRLPIPILLVSGSSTPDGEDPELPALDACTRFLRKPFEAETLLSTVGELLGRQ